MTRQKSETDLKRHPIQLIKLSVRELSIRSNVPPDAGLQADSESCSIKIGSTDYDDDQKVIIVSIRLESGTGSSDVEAPFEMEIELVGFFQVDENRFPVERLPDWARHNAPYILLPYLREHAYSLSARCGFKPLLLPLLELPTIKIQEPKGTQES